MKSPIEAWNEYDKIRSPLVTYIAETTEKVFKMHFTTYRESEKWCRELIKAKRKTDPNFKVIALYSCSLINGSFK